MSADNFECDVCYFDYSHGDHEVKVLTCGHDFCGSCLEEIYAKNTTDRFIGIICPKCRAIDSRKPDEIGTMWKLMEKCCQKDEQLKEKSVKIGKLLNQLNQASSALKNIAKKQNKSRKELMNALETLDEEIIERLLIDQRVTMFTNKCETFLKKGNFLDGNINKDCLLFEANDILKFSSDISCLSYNEFSVQYKSKRAVFCEDQSTLLSSIYLRKGCGKRWKVDYDLSGTVFGLKNIICVQHKIDLSKFEVFLRYASCVLNDDRSLCSYEIANEATLNYCLIKKLVCDQPSILHNGINEIATDSQSTTDSMSLQVKKRLRTSTNKPNYKC